MFARLSHILATAAILLVLTANVALADSPIAVTASDGKFTPGTVTLKVGQTTVLHFSSSSGVHGLQSDALGISQTLIMPGKGTDVTVTPKKAGTYVLHCTIPCGSGHETMTLTVDVEP
ncbi:MAG: cupredoxin domain-containing protein [Candidatus Aquilonibacter sp.]